MSVSERSALKRCLSYEVCLIEVSALERCLPERGVCIKRGHCVCLIEVSVLEMSVLERCQS